jgi:hypothetical protein
MNARVFRPSCKAEAQFGQLPFFENAFVSLVNLRIPIRILRLLRSANDVLDMLGIRIAVDRSWYCAETFRRRVAPHTACHWFFAVNFYKLRKINIVAKRTGDTDQVGQHDMI